MMWVALAGPAMNVLLAFIAALLAHLAGLLDGDWVALLYRSVALFMLVNLVLASFNMLPIPPLDGGRVVTALLPYALARPYAGLERYGLFIVLGLLFVLPRISPELDVMGWALRHVVAPVFSLLLRAAGHPV
jgi:Zn-dependent protease